MKHPLILVFLKHRYRFWALQPEQLNYLKNALPEFEIFVAKSFEEASQNIDRATIYYGWQFASEWVEKAQELRWIHTPSAGRDYIESDALKNSKIEFTTTSGFHGKFMAQHALGMLLYFSRQFDLSKKAFWPRDTMAETFFDLNGQKMLIVGCGAIGEQLAALSQAFGMEVYGYRRSLPNSQNKNITYVTEEELDTQYLASKIIVNLLPHTEETELFFNENVFNKFGNNKIFLNLGRGKTVCEKSLLKALDKNQVQYAGLDVLYTEPPEQQAALFAHPRVLITPHCSAFSDYYLTDALKSFVASVKKRKEDYL